LLTNDILKACNLANEITKNAHTLNIFSFEFDSDEIKTIEDGITNPPKTSSY
jgi:hypothetical protein